MTDERHRLLLLTIRRGLLMVLNAIEEYLGLKKTPDRFPDS